jgi:hypothetical protein
MPARERRSGSRRETRERDTDEGSNSLSKLISRRETDDGRKHNESETRTKTSKRLSTKTEEGGEQSSQKRKTSSILNTHEVSNRNTRPYDASTRTSSS